MGEDAGVEQTLKERFGERINGDSITCIMEGTTEPRYQLVLAAFMFSLLGTPWYADEGSEQSISIFGIPKCYAPALYYFFLGAILLWWAAASWQPKGEERNVEQEHTMSMEMSSPLSNEPSNEAESGDSGPT